MATERERIDAFLSSGRLALVGASTREKDFSREVMRALAERGMDVVPVNPHAAEKHETIEGRTPFARVSDIAPPVDAALIMTAASRSADVVADCADAGVKLVWLHRGAGPGAVSNEALRRAEELGVEAIGGRCPMMFLGEPELTHGVHRMHRGFVKLQGRYPTPYAPTPATPARRWGVALAYAVALWALCAAVLGIASLAGAGDGALIARAVAAPVAAFGLAFTYERVVRRVEPWALALLFVLAVAVLDAAVVAALIVGSFADVGHPGATWLPALLIFAGAWIGGRIGAGPALPKPHHGHAAA